MALFSTLRDIEREHWNTATGWLIYTLIFGLLPLWAGIIMLALFTFDVGLSDIADHGQFALYSAALLSTGLYFSAREFRYWNFRGRLAFVLIFGPLLIVSALLYGGVALADAVAWQVNPLILRYTSIGIFIISIPLVYISAAKNEAGTAHNIETALISQREKLEAQFEETDGGGR